MICAKCGCSDKEKRFVGAFCIDCYEFKAYLKDPKIKICKRCEKIKIGNEWTKYNEELISTYLEKKFKGDFKKVKVNFPQRKAKLTFYIDGKDIEIEKDFNLDIEETICPECLKKSSGYYEAIIQVRGSEKRVSKIAKKISKKIERESFVSKIDELKEGIDIYVGSNKVARKTLEDLNLNFKTSEKLSGVREGRRIYRITYAVRV